MSRFLVDTATEQYDVDFESRLVVRYDLPADTAGVERNPEVFVFDTVLMAIDEPIQFDLASEPRIGDVVIGVTQYVDVSA